MASKSPTKSEIISALALSTSVDKKTVKAVLDALPAIVVEALKSDGGFTIPGVAKLKATKKPATKARQGINPFTKEPTTFAAKPASLKVRAAPVKALKDAITP